MESAQGIAKTLLGDVCSRFDRSLLASPLQRTFNAAWPEYRFVAEQETSGNLDTKPQRDKCSSELRNARPKILKANPPCPLFLKLQNRNIGRSNQLESAESTVIPTRTHLIFSVRECFEQTLHLRTSIKRVVLKGIVRSEARCAAKCFFQKKIWKDPCVAGICCRANLPVSWLTNHPDLAQELQHWRESASGTEADTHVQVNNGLASARYPVELVESFLRVVREDFQGSEELSSLTALSTGPSPHEDCLLEETFVEDVRGGVLETRRVKQARREEVQWCRGSYEQDEKKYF